MARRIEDVAAAIFMLNPSSSDYRIEDGVITSVWDADGNAVTWDEAAVNAKADEIALSNLRSLRNLRLMECDWTQGADSPLSDTEKAAWATYRQQLRDIMTSGATHEDDVVWPTKP